MYGGNQVKNGPARNACKCRSPGANTSHEELTHEEALTVERGVKTDQTEKTRLSPTREARATLNLDGERDPRSGHAIKTN